MYCLFLALSLFCNNKPQLQPWLSENGLFGYIDQSERLVIPAIYIEAGLFTSTGYAIITGTNNLKGLIDSTGREVLPLRYDYIKLELINGRTLVTTEEKYVNRWRFWQWKLLPGFSFMGSNTDKRIFDTKVVRYKQQLSLAEYNKKIATYRFSHDSDPRRYGTLTCLDEQSFCQNNRLYRLREKNVKLIAKHIYGVTAENLLLQKKGAYYRIITHDGKKADRKKYKISTSLLFTIQGEPTVIKNKEYRMPLAVFKDQQGKQFIYPDFSKPFPKEVHSSADTGTFTGRITDAILVAGIPGTDCFLIGFFTPEGSYNYRILDTKGNWRSGVPVAHNFAVMQNTGDILWPYPEDVISAEQIPEDWKIASYSKYDENLLEVTIKQGKETKMGVYDKIRQEWIWFPENEYVRKIDRYADVWAFKPSGSSVYGIYNLSKGLVVVEPRYLNINNDGLVTLKEKDVYKTFYMDCTNGKEYRANQRLPEE